jgi:hypothetical protein
MNQQNVDFLKDRLFFLGFGDKLNAELEKKIEAKAEKFTLPIQGEFGKEDQKKTIDYSLDFTKSKKEDMYFLNNYTATLKNEDPTKEKSQKFYLNKGSGVTAKEAFNLLEGRAVFKNNLEKKPKEGAEPGQKPEKYEAWIQLNLGQKEDNGNFKQQQYHQKWNYDLEKSLAKHPIKELTDSNQKPDLLKSLQKGNLQQVTFIQENKEAKWFVEANPKDRNVNVYDENMRKQFQGIRQGKSEGKSEDQSQAVDGEKQKQKESMKSALKSEDEPGKKAKKRKGMAV